MTSSIYRLAAILASLCLLAACAQGPATQTNALEDIAAIRAVLDKVETTFNSADLEGAMTVFAPDAAIIAQGTPDIAGAQAIRTVYAAMMAQMKIETELTTSEIEVAGDLAYERGTYTLRLIDKASGQVVSDTRNRHVHILRRQPDGEWKTWRMIVNSAEPPPAPASP